MNATLYLTNITSVCQGDWHYKIFRLQFIDERLNLLNTGRGFSDEFEFELENYSAKSGNKLKQQYKEWTKEGSAFFKSVKDKVNYYKMAFGFV